MNRRQKAYQGAWDELQDAVDSLREAASHIHPKDKDGLALFNEAVDAVDVLRNALWDDGELGHEGFDETESRGRALDPAAFDAALRAMYDSLDDTMYSYSGLAAWLPDKPVEFGFDRSTPPVTFKSLRERVRES